MRLVFLLYAEDEALMPSDASTSRTTKSLDYLKRLRQDAADYPDTMDQRYGAWAALLSLCRLFYDGAAVRRLFAGAAWASI